MTHVLIAAVVTLGSMTQGETVKNPSVARPFSGLFMTKPVIPAPRAPSARNEARPQVPRVVSRGPSVERGPCNMPVIRAKPEVDARMIVPAHPTRTDAKIRAVEPPVCWERR